MAIFHENGYTAITAEFLLAVREHTLRLRSDGMLSEADVAALAMNADALTAPAFLVAVAGGISLML